MCLCLNLYICCVTNTWFNQMLLVTPSNSRPIVEFFCEVYGFIESLIDCSFDSLLPKSEMYRQILGTWKNTK